MIVERGKLFDPENDGVGDDEAERLKNWQQMLVGPFLTQALTDPWGRPYYFSHAASMVFSGAEDGDKDTNIISVDVRPAMAPTRAWWYDVDRNGAVTAGDYIDVKFTRPIGKVGDDSALSNFEIASQSTFIDLADDNGNIVITEACAPIHPKGQNWLRIAVTKADPQAELMAGSLLRAKEGKIFDASSNSAAGSLGLYTTKITAEALFTKEPPTASAAIQVPVSIKAAQ